MQLTRNSLSIVTAVCLILFVFGCEEDPEEESGPAEEKVVQTGRKPQIGPAIEFPSTVHNFGGIPSDSWNMCEFRFKNAGDKSLRIRKIRTTCGCTVASLEKSVYGPGEQGVIRVKYHCGLKAGLRSKHLYVLSNDEKKPEVKLTIEANIVETGGT